MAQHYANLSALSSANECIILTINITACHLQIIDRNNRSFYPAITDI